MLIVVAATLCIANLVIHYQQVQETLLLAEDTASVGSILKEVLKQFPMSLVIAVFATVFSIFVFALCGFHTYLVSLNLTTQEKLKKTYDKFPRSPFSYGSVFADWKKSILNPTRAASRITWPLFLKSSYPDEFESYR